MSTNYIQKGDVLDYTANGKDIASGDLVIIGSSAGVAKGDIENGSIGSVHIAGIYSLPKAADAITQGSKVFWSTANNNITTNKADATLIGIAANNATPRDDSVHVLLNIGL